MLPKGKAGYPVVYLCQFMEHSLLIRLLPKGRAGHPVVYLCSFHGAFPIIRLLPKGKAEHPVVYRIQIVGLRLLTVPHNQSSLLQLGLPVPERSTLQRSYKAP